MPWGRILMIEEDAGLRRLVADYFAQEGMLIIPAAHTDRFAEVQAQSAHVILLSGRLAMAAGHGFVKKLRGAKQTPVILLEPYFSSSAQDITALVNDELIKPFDISDVYVKVLKLLPCDDISTAPRVEYKGLTVDLENCIALADGDELGLPPREIELLHLLMSCIGSVISREEIASRVWGRLLSDDRVITVSINHIRSSIGGYRENIVSVRGVGYMFRP